jgi:hypothetical protein
LSAAVSSNGGVFDFPILGGVFLSQVYLRVDYARGVFGLAPANTAPITTNKLVSNCEGKDTLTPVTTSTVISSSTSSTNARLTPGSIAGISNSVLFGILLLLFTAWYFLHHRKQKLQDDENEKPEMVVIPPIQQHELGTNHMAELPSPIGPGCPIQNQPPWGWVENPTSPVKQESPVSKLGREVFESPVTPISKLHLQTG